MTGELGVQALASFLEECQTEIPSDRDVAWLDAGELMDFLGY